MYYTVRMNKKVTLLMGILLVGAVGAYFLMPTATPEPTPHAPQEPLPFVLENGFTASVFSDAVPGIRVLTRDPRGVLVASLTSEGKVVALPNTDVDNRADGVHIILNGLDRPHGIIFLEDTLYVAEEGVLRAYSYDAATMTATDPKLITELPTAGGGHFTRSLMLSPDNTHMFVAIGSSCNVCNEGDEQRAAILSVNLATKETEVFAKGLRNTVFMTLHPVTGDMWGADMGRDNLGDNLPPDEINILKEGGNYGWPICYGKNIHDTEFDKNTYIRNPCMEPFETASHIDIPAHSAPLGLVFIPEEGWPEEFWFDALVAYHGSWNRSEPTGYKIVRIDLTPEGLPTGDSTDFMTGFIDGSGKVLGRPVGLMIEPGGTLWVSDDKAGAIYRVTRTSIDE